MPNWCTNQITVSGPRERLDEFRSAHFAADTLDFERLVPMPAELKDPDREQHPGRADWQLWARNSWGTNAPGAEVFFEDDAEALVCTFDTPSTPPRRWVEAAARDMPELTLTLVWAEQGKGDAGRLQACGQDVQDEELSLGSSSDEDIAVQLDEWGFDVWHIEDEDEDDQDE